MDKGFAPAPVAWGILSTARINEKFLAGAALAEAVQILGVASRDRRRRASTPMRTT